MDRDDIEEVEIEEDHQIFDPENRRFAKREADQPKRSPIRRASRLSLMSKDGTERRRLF